MSASQVYLTIGEFNRSMDMLLRTINGRCDRMDNQLDEQTVTIAEIKATLDHTNVDEKVTARRSASGWSAGVAGVIIGAVELIKALAN
jgi:hypothetical protein